MSESVCVRVRACARVCACMRDCVHVGACMCVCVVCVSRVGLL